MSLKDRWYMWRDANGKRLEHNPMGCHCSACRAYWEAKFPQRGK